MTMYQQLATFCEQQELWLELHTLGKPLGKAGEEHQRFERLDITSKATGMTVASQLIITTPERAAAELIATLGVEELEA